MQLIETKESQNYLDIAKSLAKEFAQTAVERDAQGGTPKHERDRLRQSNLLKLIIPTEYGGLGQSWITVLQITREFAKVDSSIAHVFSYHHLGVVIPHIFGSAEQKQRYYSETIQNKWFWCNALNPLDKRTTLTPENDYFRLNGIKSFCSGSQDSDILPISATNQETGELSILAIPTQRQGVIVHHDWNNMGQRQTDSGSVTFENVLVYPEEILGSRDKSGKPFSTIRACLTQLNLANIYLGIAQGAFEAAKTYTSTNTKPWLTSGVESATQDPYILQHYGKIWVDLQAAVYLTEQAGELLQAAWEREWSLTAEQRGECALLVATAKVFATKVGLDITNRIFEVMGARATSAKYGFDRYWRNLRTFTLHDPVDYKIQDIGKWALNDELPKPNFYS
ncbi:acyl-CoA dehydrogenase family protein [Nostoc sp. 'Peltigera membranacea cyanobiont' 232]|uniref:acyl-CoA dehydrogenase family protein n=1 Tax=Nostoc sp. 'Peltigera membranacea cyanobiont' 232 TaxID=2014531 RepID=UPI000B95A073|nr:acyl-CoA dehydrogenase family protein [Nostoc sp. 'Peltigera membranacea cyanobiont' 232]OYE04229.1 monooxygenase [Nostoc sp. 'Peltigera membranacea cyanobiont' 232]